MTDRLLHVWKIIADPDVKEDEWLKAYQIVGDTPPPPVVLASNYFVTPDYKAKKSRDACLEMALIIGRFGAFVVDGFLLSLVFAAVFSPILINDFWFKYFAGNQFLAVAGIAVKEQIGLLLTGYPLLLGPWAPLTGLIHNVTFPLVLFLPVLSWFYHAGFEASHLQATPGELLFGLKVTTMSGDKLTLQQASVRHFARFINTMTLGWSLFVPLINAQQRSIEDLVAGTIVSAKEHGKIEEFLEENLPSTEMLQPFQYR
ncbi:MAG: RDD family protein [Candidatus Obscuribacter sp.]|nr:RDD family protein [Candidatus Obscuribacter sp.]